MLTSKPGLAGLAATITTKIRSVYCVSITPRINRWDQHDVIPNKQIVPDWFFPALQDLQERVKHSDGKVAIGLGFDSYTLPRDEVIRIFETARKIGARIITSHWRRNHIAGKFPPVGLQYTVS